MPSYKVLLAYSDWSSEWYSGSTYVFQGDSYPNLAKDVATARTYKRRCDAVRAAKSAVAKCGLKGYEIVEVNDV